MSAWPRRRKFTRLLKFTAAFVALIAVTLVCVRYWPRAPLQTRISSSVAVLDVHGKLLRLTATPDEQYRLWTPLDQVSPVFLEALLLHEDQDFNTHTGVDGTAVVRAAIADLSGGNRQGASTITMQLARLLYGMNTHSIGGKVLQMLAAWSLEIRYSKRELLEAHVNLLPYGGNVEGVGAATLIYFGKTPANLTLAEALTLVVIPQAPTARSPREGVEPESLKKARARLYSRWVALHPEAADQASFMDLGLRYSGTRNLPFEAPHFVNAMIARHTGVPVIRTTLDLQRQHIVERVLQGYVREQQRLGIRNAAALLVDCRNMRVVASVGSARFFDDSISGQVNGTLAKRSPGSALKPFVYALAIDQGLIHPLTVLKDAPTAFGTFSPENFDGRFNGPVTATDALVKSRNVPAIALNARLAQPSLYQFLRDSGISRMEDEKHYGLALALGGGEVTMEEAATLYAMLANRGVLRPLHYSPDDPSTAGTRLLSEEASFMTEQMLLENPRPEGSEVEPLGHLPVAWKTGTSWGFRDAWSAGHFGPYVLIVWVGNFDGSGNPAFVGVQAAAPLFFRIADALHVAEPDMHDLFLRLPPHLERVEVCAASGDLPNADCPRTVTTWFIPGKSPIRVSTIHRRVWIDTRSGLQACPPYDATYVKSEVFEFWPSDLMNLFAQAGMPRRKPPAAAPCSRETPGGDSPHIRSPLYNATYTLRAQTFGHDTIPLAANADGDVRTLHWFVDNAYVGTSPPDSAVAWAPARAGAFMVRAVDDRGRADTRELRVAVVP